MRFQRFFVRGVAYPHPVAAPPELEEEVALGSEVVFLSFSDVRVFLVARVDIVIRVGK